MDAYKFHYVRDWRTNEPLVGGANDALRNVLESYWMMMFCFELQVRSLIHGQELKFRCQEKIMTIILLKKVSSHKILLGFSFCYYVQFLKPSDPKMSTCSKN